MNLLVLYLVLLKATATAFSGMTVIPIIRDELVVKRHVITDEQLNTAIVVGRSTPGPNGLHVVCTGYFAAGVPGALMGFLALLTPAFLSIPLISFVNKRKDNLRFRSMLNAVVVASVGLMVATAWQLSGSALDTPAAWGIAALSLATLVSTRWDTVWVIAGSAGAMVLVSFFV